MTILVSVGITYTKSIILGQKFGFQIKYFEKQFENR